MVEAKPSPSEIAAVQEPNSQPNAPADSSDDDDVESLSKDDMFHILQNERRRRVLQYISGGDTTYEMRSIAEQVAAWEHDTTLQALKSDERQRVYIALYQSHLPKLDDVGLIDYNQSRGIVERKPVVDAVEPYLDPAPDAEAESTPSADSEEADSESEGQAGFTFADIRNQRFQATVVASLFLVAISWVGLTASLGVSGPALATAITGLFMLSSIGPYLGE